VVFHPALTAFNDNLSGFLCYGRSSANPTPGASSKVTSTGTAMTTEGSAGQAGPSIVPSGPARLTLIAVTVAVLAQTLRFALPLFGHLAEDSGTAGAVGLVAVAGLAGLLGPLIRAVAGPRILIGVAVGGLLAVRLVAQALSPQLWLAFAGTALCGVAVVALYEVARGLSGVGFATAAVAGLAVDTAVRVGFATWDPVWQQGVLPWLVCLVFVGLGGAALARELSSGAVRPPGISWRDALGAAALGPFLALQVLVLSSPAFVAAGGWHSLYGAHVALIIGEGLALGFLASGLAVRAVPGGVCVLGGAVLGIAAGAVTGAYALSGTLLVLVVIAAQVLAAWLLAVASRAPLRRAGTGGPIWRIDVGAALGGLVLVLVLVPYALSTLDPLPVPGNLLPGAAGLGLGLLAAIAAAQGGPLPARAPLRAVAGGAVAAVLLAGTAVFYLTDSGDGATAPVAGSGKLRVVSVDIHAGLTRSGALDPESVAAGIKRQHPDVVLLQEVGRGSLLAGTTDLGVWLSRRLGMHLVWGPAADGQFGNAILTSRPVRSSGARRLPYATGEEPRGYVWARLAVGSGTVEVWSTGLQDGATRGRIRQAEIGTLVKDWSGGPRTVIGGSMQADSSSPDLQGLFNAGMQTATGDDGAQNARTGVIVGTPDLTLTDLEVAKAGIDGHYLITVTVAVPEG